MHLNVASLCSSLSDCLQTSIDLSTSRLHNYLKSWWWSSSLRRSDHARFEWSCEGASELAVVRLIRSIVCLSQVFLVVWIVCPRLNRLIGSLRRTWSLLKVGQLGLDIFWLFEMGWGGCSMQLDKFDCRTQFKGFWLCISLVPVWASN